MGCCFIFNYMYVGDSTVDLPSQILSVVQQLVFLFQSICRISRTDFCIYVGGHIHWLGSLPNMMIPKLGCTACNAIVFQLGSRFFCILSLHLIGGQSYGQSFKVICLLSRSMLLCMHTCSAH